MARIPKNAFEIYVAAGPNRSYAALAEQLGVSKTAVTRRATVENWQERLDQIERKAQVRVEEKAVDELEAIKLRQLQAVRLLQARALQTLKDQPAELGIRAASALQIALKHELLLLGEPTERQSNVEELIKRETRELLRVVEDDAEPDGGRRSG
ncbi:MAG TPA: hypothetical protein VJP77_04440 [Planctomycetota bacterium]|nr:hypothetical protein [Planctomycetota bacterium]